MSEREKHDSFYEEICDREDVSYAYATLLDDLWYEKQKTKAAQELIDLLIEDSIFVLRNLKKAENEDYLNMMFDSLKANQDKTNELLKKVRG